MTGAKEERWGQSEDLKKERAALRFTESSCWPWKKKDNKRSTTNINYKAREQ